MDSKVADTLRHVFILAVLAAIGIFGYKQYKKYDAKKQLVETFRAEISDANFFHALRESDAKATLLRAVAHMKKAQQMGLEPPAFLDLALGDGKKSNGLTETTETMSSREKMIRGTVTSAFEHSRQLGLLDDPANIASLLAGDMPAVVPPPVFEHVVDPALSPGLEKIVANLTIEPELRAPGAVPTDIEVAAFRQLIYDLTDANIIDRTAQKRIFEAYGPTKSPTPPAPVEPAAKVKPVPAPAPEPPPAPKPEPAAPPEKTGFVPDKPEPVFVLPK